MQASVKPSMLSALINSSASKREDIPYLRDSNAHFS